MRERIEGHEHIIEPQTLCLVPSVSGRNAASEMVNAAKPHAKQTASLGNTGIPGLSRSLRPEKEKWIIISATNFASLPDPHDLHAIIVFSPLQAALHFYDPSPTDTLVRTATNAPDKRSSRFQPVSAPYVLLNRKTRNEGQNSKGVSKKLIETRLTTRRQDAHRWLDFSPPGVYCIEITEA